MYGFIGDIHGHADELRQLLEKLEYEQHDETLVTSAAEGDISW